MPPPADGDYLQLRVNWGAGTAGCDSVRPHAAGNACMSEDKELRIPVRIRATGLIMSIMGTIRPERWGHS
jgi:hypothetical protein